MKLRTCVTPKGQFVYGVHKPDYSVHNLRNKTKIEELGCLESGEAYSNAANFPKGEVEVKGADWIFEIPNPLSFRGSTFIDKEWADASMKNPGRIGIPPKEALSFTGLLDDEEIPRSLFSKLPAPLLLALATTSTDPDDLIQLAEIACDFKKDASMQPTGLLYRTEADGRIHAVIHRHYLFEAVANNPVLPEEYQKAMVLRPGAQGGSEIIGEYEEGNSHIYEYLRRNSYIAGGHYAANMGDDAIRYSIDSLTETDMRGLRHLYYQRTFIRLASLLGMDRENEEGQLSVKALESLRMTIVEKLENGSSPEFTATLWGWNFGFDYAPTGYRLHASHQQVHQQYAMLPQNVETFSGNPEQPTGTMDSFGCGDMVAEIMHDYREEHNYDFFTDYLTCIRNNVRMDGREGQNLNSSLIIWENEHAILFVPKAQTSQWELQLMALNNTEGEAVGNILEADRECRKSLDRGIFLAQKVLAGLGARMVTSIEYPKRLGEAGEPGQHLLYSLLPRLPESPGAFSEAQLRYINGHYPEDFAAVCREELKRMGISLHSSEKSSE